jgi:hypothetical protein
MNDLTSKDTVRLAEMERVIESGLSTFQAVGRALMTIREERLYRETHSNFEDYCRERWKFRRRYADRLIQACQIGKDSSPNGTQPETERQARKLISNELLAEIKRKALASLSPEERDEAIQADEDRLKRNSMPHTRGGQGRVEQMVKLERVGKRWHDLLEGLGDEAEPYLKRFDRLQADVMEDLA